MKELTMVSTLSQQRNTVSEVGEPKAGIRASLARSHAGLDQLEAALKNILQNISPSPATPAQTVTDPVEVGVAHSCESLESDIKRCLQVAREIFDSF